MVAWQGDHDRMNFPLRVVLQKTRPRNCECLVWRTLVFHYSRITNLFSSAAVMDWSLTTARTVVDQLYHKVTVKD